MLDALPIELLWLVLDAGTVWVSRATARTCRRLRDVAVHHSRRLMARLATRVGVDIPPSMQRSGVPRTRIGVCVRHARIVLRVVRAMPCYDVIAATWDADGMHLTYMAPGNTMVFNITLNNGTFDRIWSVPRGRRAPGRSGAMQGPRSAIMLLMDDETIATGDRDAVIVCRVALYCTRPRDTTATDEECKQLLELARYPEHIGFHRLEQCPVVGHVDAPPRALLRDVRRLMAVHMSPPKGSWTDRWDSPPPLWLGLATDVRAHKVRRSCATVRPSAQDAKYALLCGERPDDGRGHRWMPLLLCTLTNVLRMWAPASDRVGLSLVDCPAGGRVLRRRNRLRGGIGSTDVWMAGVADE